MEYQKVEGERRNSFLYIAGNNCYVKNKNHNGYIYLKCKNYCEGGAFYILFLFLLRFLFLYLTRGVKGKVSFRVIGGWDRG